MLFYSNIKDKDFEQKRAEKRPYSWVLLTASNNSSDLINYLGYIFALFVGSFGE